MNRKFLNRSIFTAILLLPAIQSAALATCTTTGTSLSYHCGSDYINYYTGTGDSSLIVTGETTASIELKPDNAVSGTFNQFLTINNSVLNRNDYSAVISQTNAANRNITVTIDAASQLSAIGGFGAVWIRNDTSGDVIVNNAATVVYDAINNTYGAVDARTNNGNVTLTNSGDVTAINGARGLYADGGSNTSDVLVKIVNTGDVTASGAAIRTINYKGLSQIQNDGTATSTDRQGLVAWSSDGPASISNSGVVTSYKDIAIQAATEYGDITIINSGQVNAPTDLAGATNSGHTAEAIRAAVDMDDTMTPLGYGDISITNTANGVLNSPVDYAVYAETPNGDIHFTNQGRITALNGGYFNTLSGSITINNEGTISSENKAIVINSGTIANITNQTTGVIESLLNGNVSKDAYVIDTLTDTVLTNYGTLKGNFKDSNNKLTVNNHGLIELSYDTNGVNSAKINTFVQSSDGTLKINLLSDSSSITGYSQLQTKDATFNDGSTIDVNVLTLSANQGLLIGKKLTDVVSASNSLIVNGKLNITDNSALLDFVYVQDGSTLDLNVVNGSSILDSTVAGGGQIPSQSIAGLLDKANDNGVPAMAGFLSDLGGLSSNAQVAQAVSNAAPDTVGAVSGAASQIVNSVQSIVEQRQSVGFGGGLNSGDIAFSEKSVWLKPFGSFGSQNDKNSMNGFDVNSYGLGMGIDGEYAPNQKIGFGFFFTKAKVDINNVNQEADINAYTTLVYGSAPILDEQTKFLYQIGYSWIKTDTTKIIIGNDAKADYTANSTFLDLKLMRNYQINQDWKLQPIVEMTYRHFTTPAYTESYTNMSYAESTATELLAGLGVRSIYKLDDNSQFVANVNVAYDLKDDTQGVNVSFPSTSSTFVKGIDNGRWSYKAGIGYERNINKNNNITLLLDHEGQGSDFTNNTVSVKYVYKF